MIAYVNGRYIKQGTRYKGKWSSRNKPRRPRRRQQKKEVLKSMPNP